MSICIDSDLLGRAPLFTALLRSLEIAAATDVTVMLQGESGTGKELLANLLHQQSARRDAPFVAINCAALPETLAESELFGHRKGAFTGATSHNAGRISSAEGGTLFLDEIAEMPLTVQAKLLRFLESGEYQAVGDTAGKIADIRIVAATHAELRNKVQSGLFRADLYYRLNVVPFVVPSLRERSDDIRMLIETFSAAAAERYRLQQPQYDESCMRLLERYDWPGNIRELRNLCERMVIMFPGKKIGADNLPCEIHASSGKRPYALSLPDAGLKLEDLEQDLLQQALEKTFGNRSKAAGMLGLSRHTFLYRLKKYSIA